MNWQNWVLFFLMTPLLCSAQFKIEWNLSVDLELSKAGSLSHYYYNEIHRNSTDWSLNLSRSDLITNFQFTERFQLAAHIFSERALGQRPGFFKDWNTYFLELAQLHLKWTSKNEKLQVRLGRMYNPFGAWYQEQRYIDRDILSAPLMYAYYTNVSPYFGYVPDLAEENKIPTPDGIDWGLSTLYRLGYKDGISIRFGNITSLNAQVAFLTGTASVRETDFDNPSWAINAKVIWPATYWLNIGATAEYGTYLMSHLDIDDGDYKQTSYALYYTIASGFFQLKGELIASQFTAPLYDSEIEDFIREGNGPSEFNLDNLGFYNTFTYEPPWLSGSYFSLRMDLLNFSDEANISNTNRDWDDDVMRFSAGFGYKFSNVLSARITVSTQSTQNRNWDNHQRILRAILSYEI